MFFVDYFERNELKRRVFSNLTSIKTMFLTRKILTIRLACVYVCLKNDLQSNNAAKTIKGEVV